MLHRVPRGFTHIPVDASSATGDCATKLPHPLYFSSPALDIINLAHKKLIYFLLSFYYIQHSRITVFEGGKNHVPIFGKF